jgi:hypothetical protein
MTLTFWAFRGRHRDSGSEHRLLQGGPQGTGHAGAAESAEAAKADLAEQAYKAEQAEKARALRTVAKPCASNGHIYRTHETGWRCATCGNFVPRVDGELYGPGGEGRVERRREGR